MGTIKDSGNRREFESGAVRDMADPSNPKGRCDLMPLEVVAAILEDKTIHHIARFMASYNSRYLYEALDNFADHAYLGNHSNMFLEVAIHFEEGAAKYGVHNWKKGIPVWCYIDSATRHYLKWRKGETDERHDRAFVWNIMCCIWETDFREGDI